MSTTTLKEKKDAKSVEGAMCAANQKIAYLTAEIKKLKDERVELMERCQCFVKQVVKYIMFLFAMFLSIFDIFFKDNQSRSRNRKAFLAFGGRKASPSYK